MPLAIGVIGDYKPDFRPHQATDAAVQHVAVHIGIDIHTTWLPTVPLKRDVEARLRGFDALWCAPGSPYQSMAGALNGIQFARERNWPLLGTCGGFQHLVIEYARNVLGFADAAHEESDPDASYLFISALSCSLVGQTMDVQLDPESRVFRFYQQRTVQEQYYCNFGLNPAYQRLIHDGGLRVAGRDQDGEARIVELPDHRFFLGTLFVPQLTSTAQRPHPLIMAYIQAAVAFKQERPRPPW
jgi:CTP synthase (UTP-ammonia lyase)